MSKRQKHNVERLKHDINIAEITFTKENQNYTTLQKHKDMSTQKQLTRNFITLFTLLHKPPHKLDKMEDNSERWGQRGLFVVLHHKIVVLVLPYLVRIKLNLVKHVTEI